MRTVDSSDWLETARDLHDTGFALMDFVTSVDRGARLEVIARVVNPDSKVGQVVSTFISRDSAAISSWTAVYPGSGWHEREAREMFGIDFVGLVDSRPLLRRAALGEPPLLKSSVLVARAVREWPGAAEPKDDGRRGGNPSRRRQRPAGVPENFIKGES
jgi:NADH-quinone oxidoreductase subunit C